MGILFQILCTGIISAMGVNMGLIYAWPASTITIFATKNTTLTRVMTETEISLLGSLSSVGALISNLTAGFLLDRLGRKRCSILTALSLVIFWALLCVSRSVEVVLTSIFLSGICSSTFLVSSVYVSEICQDSIRGSMSAANLVSNVLGTLLSYLLGGFLAYDVMLYVGLISAVAGTALLFVLKDSPIYLMSIKNEKEAAQAIAFFRHLKTSDKEIIEELSKMKRSLNPELDDQTPEMEELKPDMIAPKKLTFWQFMKKSQSTRQALLVNLVVVTASIFQGLVVVQIYIKALLEETMPEANSTLLSVVMAVIGVVASVLSAYFTDVIGRRPLMVYGSFSGGVCSIILGTQIQLHWGPSWLFVVFINLFAVMFILGAGTVPFVLLAELFLPEVKSIVSMVVVEWTWLCNFIILFICNPLINAWGWGPLFYIFAVVCFLTSVFCIFYLPETKGLSVEEIQPLFTNKKHRHNAQH